MPSTSKLDFGLSLEDDKSYALKGSTLKKIQQLLQADRIVPGANQTESQTSAGRVIHGATVEAIAAAACAWAPVLDPDSPRYTVSPTGLLFKSLSSTERVSISNRNGAFSYPGYCYIVHETPESGNPSTSLLHSNSELEPYDIEESSDTGLDIIVASRALLFEINRDGEVVTQFRCSHLALGERPVPGAGIGFVFEAL